MTNKREIRATRSTPLRVAVGEVALSAALDSETPPEVMAYPQQCPSCNAVKFTNSGEVTCTATRSNDALAISVRDAGVRIAPEEQANVIEEFKQGGDTLADKPRGMGLDLAIYEQIVVCFEDSLCRACAV
jgi:light-regulated signal transduction histidine kinase (bacteriophytochrome)